MVDEVFHLVRPAFHNYECIWRPNVDVYESTDEIIVLADMAGLNKEELHIEVNRKQIKIAGVRKAVQHLQNAHYCQAEIRTVILKESFLCLLPSNPVGESVLCRRNFNGQNQQAAREQVASHFHHFGKIAKISFRKITLEVKNDGTNCPATK